MIRGWRNDPKWVEHYERRRAEYAVRQFEKAKIDWEFKNRADQLLRQIDEIKGRNVWREAA